MKNPRKHYFAVEKVAIRQRKLIELALVSDLCDQYHIQTSIFYNWQIQFFEKGGPLPSSYLARRRKSIKSDESPPFTKAMARSSDGVVRSNRSASVPAHHSQWRMPFALLTTMSDTAMRSDCGARSAMELQWIKCAVGTS